MWKGKFDLRQYEHSEFREVQNSERQQKLIKKRLKPVESPVGLIIIGIVSIFILIMIPKVMQNRQMHNLLKLLYSGVSILAVVGVFTIPLGIYRFIKGKG